MSDNADRALAEAAADEMFPERALAPENEQRAEDFAAGYQAGMLAARPVITEEAAVRALDSWYGVHIEWNDKARDGMRAALEAAFGETYQSIEGEHS